MMHMNVVARALELARSGNYTSHTQLVVALHKEGFPDAEVHLDGKAMRSQLLAAMKAASLPGNDD